MKALLAVVVVVLIAGCTSARISRSLSSGAIGCPSDEITITNERASIVGTHEWIAECKGKRYVCNYVSGGNANCKEAVK